MFDDVESRLSSYMLSVSMINLLLAVVVSGAMWLLGVPSPMLWGLLAGMLNFIIYIGPAVMALASCLRWGFRFIASFR